MKKSFQRGSTWEMSALTYAPQCEKKGFIWHPMRAWLPYFSVTRFIKTNKIFKENRQFYIGKVQEEIILGWRHVRNVSIKIRSWMWKKRPLFGHRTLWAHRYLILVWRDRAKAILYSKRTNNFTLEKCMKQSFQHDSTWEMLALTYDPVCERKGAYLGPYARIATPF